MIGHSKGEPIVVLAADDDDDALFALRHTLEPHGYKVETTTDPHMVQKLALKREPHVVVLDVSMPGLSGHEVARQLKSHKELRYIPIILVTGKNTIEDIVAGFDSGANDYIVKPFEPEVLLARLHAALRTRQLYAELSQAHSRNIELRHQLKERSSLSNITGRSETMRDVFRLLEKVAPTDVPILITGESGTGKELVAHAIHQMSKRSANRMVVQNCSAISEQLLESELFGHVKGAFTGAAKDKEGLFPAAHEGSFFLDELGEMSGALQAKLLRVLQDGSITPVGSTESLRVDVRIIAATHRNLPQLIAAGTFREDLYYRLNVVTIQLPPLRDRKEDIPLLCDRFLTRSAEERKGTPRSLSKDSLRLLLDYSWPGNIRQLENEIRRADILANREEIEPEDFSSALHTTGSSTPQAERTVLDEHTPGHDHSLKDAIEALEAKMIARVMAQTGGNKSEASRILGISRSSLITKAQAYGLDDT